jgi:NifU-like protein
MSLSELISPFPWARYSKKLASKIDNPRNVGLFLADDAEARGVQLAIGSEGQISEGNCVRFYWLVDKEDGLILDAKFQMWGQSALIGAADTACELIIGKNYDQAKRVSADLLDRHLRDRAEEPAFPKETYPLLNLVLGALETASDQCVGIPFADTYVAPPMPSSIGETIPGGYPGWKELTLKKKIAVIEEILDRDVRPYIALDAGGIEVLNLIEEKQVIIAYQGSCTSCYSSIGTTLSFIQQILRAKVHPDLVVIPDMDFQNL